MANDGAVIDVISGMKKMRRKRDDDHCTCINGLVRFRVAQLSVSRRISLQPVTAHGVAKAQPRKKIPEANNSAENKIEVHGENGAQLNQFTAEMIDDRVKNEIRGAHPSRDVLRCWYVA